MLKKLKNRLKKLHDNSGSSFVLVIVATTFLSILISALMMGTLLAYKLKYYKLNSLNNFYSVEKSMDEIYAGIGAITNEHLYSAYTATAEVVVYYKDGQYDNLTDDEANDLFKSLFISGIVDDKQLSDMSSFINALKSWISDSKVELDTSNLKIVYTDKNKANRYKICTTTKKKDGTIAYKFTETAEPGFDADSIDTITFKNVGVKRTIELGAADKETMAPGEYIQSITTDIVLTKPEYNVSFDLTANNSDSFYNYAILADMGLEVDSTDTSTSDVKVRGNIYTASDYYNKDYNSKADTKVTKLYDTDVSTKWGSEEKSANSGIFVNGKNSTLTFNSDIIVCSGTLAAYDGASINVSGRTGLLTELWTDNIVIGGDKGGTINAAANAYVYDDTELNAEKSNLTFTKGRYFGYSYTADDVRSIKLLADSGNLATGYKLKSHFSDSAIIVNGKDSTLNLKGLDSLYIAGKSYIEFSKIAVSNVREEDKINEGTTEADAGTNTATTEADAGTTTTEENKKTVYAYDADDDDVKYAYTTLQDYSTGQSLDVKSNQLVFLTQWEPTADETVVDDAGYTHVKLNFPKTLSNDATIQNLYSSFLKEISTGEYTVDAIRQTVSGHNYYYLNFSEGDADGKGKTDTAEEFVTKYYNTLQQAIADANDETLGRMYNVVNYESFDVKLILPSSSDGTVDDSKIKTGAALTAQNSSSALFVQKSVDTKLDVANALKLASTSKTNTMLLGNKGATENNNVYTALQKNANALSLSTGATDEEKISNFLTYMYINMKDHLSIVDKTDDAEKDISAWDIAEYTKNGSSYTYSKDLTTQNKDYSYNYSITPLTNYIDYESIFNANGGLGESINLTIDSDDSTSRVIVNSGSVTLTSAESDGSFQGIVICGGNVIIDSSVKSFRGMIIAGGKVVCSSSVDISSDASFTENLLKTCAEATGDGADITAQQKRQATKYIKNFETIENSSSTEVDGLTISDISYHDILAFNNWKKNVE